jgi:hypothetical protein
MWQGHLIAATKIRILALFPINTGRPHQLMSSSYPHLAYMHSSQPIVLSLWDASQMFEYATSRYTAILAALEKSQVPRTLTFRRQFVWYLVWEAKVSRTFHNLVSPLMLSPEIRVPLDQHMRHQQCVALPARVSE